MKKIQFKETRIGISNLTSATPSERQGNYLDGPLNTKDNRQGGISVRTMSASGEPALSKREEKSQISEQKVSEFINNIGGFKSKKRNLQKKLLPNWNIKAKRSSTDQAAEKKNLMHLKIYNKSLADSRIFQRYNQSIYQVKSKYTENEDVIYDDFMTFESHQPDLRFKPGQGQRVDTEETG